MSLDGLSRVWLSVDTAVVVTLQCQGYVGSACRRVTSHVQRCDAYSGQITLRRSNKDVSLSLSDGANVVAVKPLILILI